MSPEPPRSEPTAWREALRAADAAAHAVEAAHVRATAVEQLEARLVRANADRLALREAVNVRDVLLRRFLAQERAVPPKDPPARGSAPAEGAPMSPRISLLIPGSEADTAVRRTVASVRRQGCSDVEVVLGGRLPKAFNGHRSRPGGGDVRAASEPTRGDGTAWLLETARKRAQGTVIGVLGPGDELEPGALRAALMMLEHLPSLDVLYTDEQWAARGADGIATKPDYLPHYLEGFPYLGRVVLVRAELLARVGGFRAGFEGAEEWDAHLRVTELTDHIGHLPVIAVLRASAPRADAVAAASGRRAVEGRIARSGRAGTAEQTAVPLGVRLWWTLEEPPLVSIVMPTAGGRRQVRGQEQLLVENCLRSLRAHTTYDRWELILVTSEHTPPGVVPRIRELLGDRLVHAPIAGAFNFSASVNEGARLAHGSHLLLLNDDTEVIEPRWLDRMVSVAAGDSIGAVGAKLLFEDGTIQHLGITVDDHGVPIHPLGSEVDGPGRFGTKELDLDYLAVTGACLLTPADLFRDVGGFSEDLPLNYNDIDYCLKVSARGLSVVSTPFARLHHYESSTRGHALEAREQAFLDRHWGLRLGNDPHVQYRSML